SENIEHRTNGESAIRNPQSTIGNLFIFDEPTVGLHFDDVSILLRLFQRLVDRGHSIVVIEHNLEVIKCADWIVDLGPEAGIEGGWIVANGKPEQIAKVENSHTGRFLRSVLSRPTERLPVIPSREDGAGPHKTSRELKRSFAYAQDDSVVSARAAEEASGFRVHSNGAITIHGAREHNLKNIDVKIP